MKPLQWSLLSCDRRFFILGALVLAGKVLFYFADPMPLFYIGDSITYIDSAIDGSIPAYRSFTYGLMIRWLSVHPHTLSTLIFAQVIASAITVCLLTFALVYFFNVRRLIAMAAGVVLALDPLQILHERMVMTEAFTNLIFAVNLLLGFAYVRRPRVITIVALCINGIFLVSLRVVYVPIVLTEAVFLPVLGWSFLANCPNRTKHFVTHQSAFVLTTVLLHGAYCYYVGKMGDVPPTYLYGDGFSLIGAWAPVLKAEDAADARAQNVIERQARNPVYPLKRRDLRWAQVWHRDGLANQLREAFGGNDYVANHVAKRISWQAFRRSPLSVAELTWLTFYDYWMRPAYVRKALYEEQGSARPVPGFFVQQLSARFGLEPADTHAVMSPSKRYHLAAAEWNYILLSSPLACLFAVWLADSASRRAAILLFVVTSLLLLVTCVGSAGSPYRYLHPFSFPGLVAYAIVTEAIRRSWEYRFQQPSTATKSRLKNAN